MLSEHEIGEDFMCDECDFKEEDRGKLVEHIEVYHGTEFTTCS